MLEKERARGKTTRVKIKNKKSRAKPLVYTVYFDVVKT
jgi:hypothetical protein